MLRRSILRAVRSPRDAPCCRRWASTEPPPPQAPPPHSQSAKITGRFDRFVERTPRFLRPTLAGLRTAPIPHVVAFFILHEITAVVPLFGLGSAFYYWRWLPTYFADGAWISAGVEKFGRYFRKKGWISEREEQRLEEETVRGKTDGAAEQGTLQWFQQSEDATRLVVAFATAYAVVKVMLPVRIAVSVWGSPWFAKLAVIPVGRGVRRLVQKLRPTGSPSK